MEFLLRFISIIHDQRTHIQYVGTNGTIQIYGIMVNGRSQIDSACDSGHSGHLGHIDNSHHFSMILIHGMNDFMAALFHRSPRICPVPKSVPH
ncbi:MAG: hypothetical protein EZS28_053678 [Streblomastix strix]|uniref:Uncharacterized protein n=1 Tax=Streblomastix strix TaxID=222440 RepID=A0A5J4R6P0_9EUKA|nr:MAG: hypothetical protein EZS28_053678 [Streblomastix strix]